jgi:competence ComEA-like helix-hairpin-helix protein
MTLALTPALAAFEQVPQSPATAGGGASALFPTCALALCDNPASIGLLGGFSASLGAARPFGLERLDRASAAVSLPFDPVAAGAACLVSGDDSYSEFTATGAVAGRILAGLLGGLSASVHRLSIEGYGSCGAFSADAGMAARPFEGVMLGASVRGLVRSGLGSSGDPSVPRSVTVAAGVAPVEGLTFAASLTMQEGLGAEPCFAASYSPARVVAVTLGTRADPVRLDFGIVLGVGPVEFLYGLGSHPSLGQTHSAGLSYGRAAYRPAPLLTPPSTAGVEESPGLPVDLNTADSPTLQLVPGIGPSRAGAIIAWREEHGPFESVEDLLEVPGIGPGLLESIRPWVRVD